MAERGIKTHVGFEHTTADASAGRKAFRSRLFLGRLLGALLLAWFCGWHGSSPSVAQQPSAAPFEQRPGWLLQAQSILKVELVQGRITITSVEVLPATQAAARTRDGREENLRIQTHGGAVSLGYQLTDDDKEISYEVQHGSELRIRQRARRDGSATTVDYQQPLRGPVQLDIGDGPQRRTLRGASIWHLLLIEPGPTRTHLAPLVEILRPSTRLATVADDVRGSLFQAALGSDLPAMEEVVRLVRLLDNPSFQKRHGADRTLRAMGPGVGAHLVAIDPATLSLEQRERVKGILDGLAGPSIDTPERVAAWLATDPLVWVELLRDDSLPRRQSAAAHLTRLTGAPVSFTPEADDRQRELQVASLRRQLEGSRP